MRKEAAMKVCVKDDQVVMKSGRKVVVLKSAKMLSQFPDINGETPTPGDEISVDFWKTTMRVIGVAFIPDLILLFSVEKGDAGGIYGLLQGTTFYKVRR